MRFLIGVVILTSAAIGQAEPYTGAFATDGVFDVSVNDHRAVRNQLELTQTGTQIRGRLVLDATTTVDVTGAVAANGAASLVFSNRTFPIARVKGALELTLGDSIFLFKRAPPLAPLPAAVLTAGSASTGTRFTSPWWSVAAPAGWTSKPRGTDVLLEGDRIAIYARLPRASADQTRDALAAVLNERGGEWQLMQKPVQAQLPGGTVELLEVAGFDGDEVEWRARVVGVTTKLGTVTVTGIARVGDLDKLRSRVDEVARSATIATPAASPAAKTVTGEWWIYEPMSRSIGNGGTTYTMSLCANGAYTEVNETSGTTHSSLNNPGIVLNSKTTVTGRWALGTKPGTIQILRDDGKTTELGYRVSGTKVAFGRGQPYFRKALGRCP